MFRTIPQAPVGFLTLFERQGQEGHPLLIVGSNLKRPLSNIFVVQSESHYSCLWAQGPCPDLSLPAETEHLIGGEEGEVLEELDEGPPGTNLSNV